jgi:glycosyltransferase involved in cell wall biosynthesis
VPPASRDHRLSVIVPVYNEKTTFTQMMEQLLAKEIPNLSIDIIIVESKSSDGTRELVTNYEKNPKVTVIYQAEAKGKGNAVRAGLAIAKGDYIIIQDADLEYDLDDYDLLLEPLKRYRRAFVLGSRHTSRGAWKIRQFSKSRYLGVTMNVAHLVLAGIFNCLFFQSIKDPFTMFKVFRRDCLHDMNLTCNGFDFDCELIARLVQAGYRPLEIPINYSSRSFAEGKKISFFGDPPTYIAAFLKCRFSKARG